MSAAAAAASSPVSPPPSPPPHLAAASGVTAVATKVAGTHGRAFSFIRALAALQAENAAGSAAAASTDGASVPSSPQVAMSNGASGKSSAKGNIKTRVQTPHHTVVLASANLTPTAATPSADEASAPPTPHTPSYVATPGGAGGAGAQAAHKSASYGHLTLAIATPSHAASAGGASASSTPPIVATPGGAGGAGVQARHRSASYSASSLTPAAAAYPATPPAYGAGVAAETPRSFFEGGYVEDDAVTAQTTTIVKTRAVVNFVGTQFLAAGAQGHHRSHTCPDARAAAAAAVDYTQTVESSVETVVMSLRGVHQRTLTDSSTLSPDAAETPSPLSNA